MRKFILLFCILVYKDASAQYSFGIKGGISIPSLKGNTEQSKGYKSNKAFYKGLIANYKISRLISLQAEVNYSPQGGVRNGMQPIPADALKGIVLPPGQKIYANFNNKAILNYLEVPILAKFTIGRKIKYYACVGPYFSVLLEAITKTSGFSLLYEDEAGTKPLTQNGNALPPIPFNNKTDIKGSIKSLNIGAQGGVGFQYPFGPGSVQLEGRGIMGISNIQSNPAKDGKNQTGSLVVTLGYLIKL